MCKRAYKVASPAVSHQLRPRFSTYISSLYTTQFKKIDISVEIRWTEKTENLLTLSLKIIYLIMLSIFDSIWPIDSQVIVY